MAPDADVSTSNAGASPAAIARHYDVGNDFFALWLDPTLAYSCALWGADDDLHRAQIRKFEYFLDHMDARDSRILDVGCGFGGLLRHAVDAYGVESAIGLTLSVAQHEERCRDSRVATRLESWQDHVPPHLYDGIVSVGAFEHFARPECDYAERLVAYEAFFAAAHSWLEPDGALGLQSIVNENAQPATTAPRSALTAFFYEEVFPEPSLPRLAEILTAADPYFEVVGVRVDGAHYARTCRDWRSALFARRDEAERVAGADVTTWHLRYLGMSELAFRSDWCNLSRLLFTRRAEPLSGMWRT